MTKPQVANRPLQLDYRRPEPQPGLLSSLIEDIGWFLGLIVGKLGGPRQALLACGLGCLGNGIGLLFGNTYSSAHTWLAVGGFLVGLVIPVRGTKRATPK